MSIELNLIQNQPLASFSTFGIGGKAKLFIEVKTVDEMRKIRRFINREKMPFWVIGRGSNSLFSDQGFNGLVIFNRICFCNFDQDKGYLSVGAGYNFSLLGSQVSRKQWSGLEFASGIPGSVGGAIFMNAGANGFETSDVLLTVLYVDQTGEVIEKKRKDLNFSYRSSSFHKNCGIIVSGTFKLKKCPQARIKQMKITKYRIATQPYGQSSAGCIFRNPLEGKSAGALIEACGLKGKRIGGAQVSTLHANFIVNSGGASANDVMKLAKFMCKTVYEQTGIKLELELQLIPYHGESNGVSS